MRRTRWIGWSVVVASLIFAGCVGATAYVQTQHESASEARERAGMLQAPLDASNDRARLAVSVEPGQVATAGERLRFRTSITDASGNALPNAKLTVRLMDAEEDVMVFAARTTTSDGTLMWDLVPPKAASYVLNVVAAPADPNGPAFAPLEVEPAVIVEQVSPPLTESLRGAAPLAAIVLSTGVLGVWAAGTKRARPGTPAATQAPVAAIAV